MSSVRLCVDIGFVLGIFSFNIDVAILLDYSNMKFSLFLVSLNIGFGNRLLVHKMFLIGSSFYLQIKCKFVQLKLCLLKNNKF